MQERKQVETLGTNVEEVLVRFEEAFGDYCFPTGSYAFGVATHKSDIDIVVLESLFDPTGWTAGQVYGSWKIKHEASGLVINVLLKNKYDFETWKIATEMLKLLPTSALVNKFKRIGLFELLRGVASTVVTAPKITEIHNRKRYQ